MNPKTENKYPERMNSFMTTEHFTLQSARSIINSEISSRVTIYFTTLSSVIIAAAFVAQIPDMNQVFILFGSLAFPLVILLGFFTAARLGILSGMDAMYIRAINRIRHFYVQSASEVSQFMLFPPHDDDRSNGIYGGWSPASMRDNLLSSANAVVISNSIVITVLLGVIVTGYYKLSFLQFLPIGVVVFIVSYFLHYVVAILLVRPQFQADEYLEIRFPASDLDMGNFEEEANPKR